MTGFCSFYYLYHKTLTRVSRRKEIQNSILVVVSEKAMAPHSSTLAWKTPWMEEPGGLQSMGLLSRTWLSDFAFTFHFHALEKEMATHSSVLAWRIPGTGEPGGLLSMGSHRVGHDWSNLAAAAAAVTLQNKFFPNCACSWDLSSSSYLTWHKMSYGWILLTG